MMAATLTTVAYVAAWAAFFGYECTVAELQERSRRTPVVAAIIAVVTCTLPGFCTPLFGIWIPIVVLVSAGLIRRLDRELPVWLPWVVGIPLIVLLVYPTAGAALKDMDFEDIRYHRTERLAFLHFSLILLLIGLNLMLWCRVWQRHLPAIRFAAVATLVSVVCIGVTVYLTFPRGGDEGLTLWIFLLPGLLITGTPLLLLGVVVAVGSVFQAILERIDARQSPPSPPLQLEPTPKPGPTPKPAATPPVLTPKSGDTHLNLFDCPYCHTRGVLRMSDGRCPNCKTPLEDN
jgi:hypothetical protein